MSKFDATALTPAESNLRYLRYDVPQELTPDERTALQTTIGVIGAGTGGVAVDTDPDGFTVLVIL